MILIEVVNAPEVVKEKGGKFIEGLTPNQLDLKIVESQVIKIMIEQFAKEGLKGKITRAKGIKIEGFSLKTENSFEIKDSKERRNSLKSRLRRQRYEFIALSTDNDLVVYPPLQTTL